MYGQYFVKKVSIGENILMTVIAESASVDMGQLDIMISEFEENFTSVDEYINQINMQWVVKRQARMLNTWRAMVSHSSTL